MKTCSRCGGDPVIVDIEDSFGVVYYVACKNMFFGDEDVSCCNQSGSYETENEAVKDWDNKNG